MSTLFSLQLGRGGADEASRIAAMICGDDDAESIEQMRPGCDHRERCGSPRGPTLKGPDSSLAMRGGHPSCSCMSERNGAFVVAFLNSRL
jgi:hypothetical protein